LKWENKLVIALLSWVSGIAALNGLLMYFGHINEVRYILSALFLSGASLSVWGYYRFSVGGPTIPALLAVSMVQSVAFALFGVAFLVLAIGYGSAQVVTTDLFIAYILYSIAASVKFYKGVFVVTGRGRGWISRDVHKPFWYRKR
jgi:hypothetical protein